MEEMKVTKFPEGFLWGSASAAYQIEGGWRDEGVDTSLPPRLCGSGARVHVRSDRGGERSLPLLAGSLHLARKGVHLREEPRRSRKRH